jgi:hypothetical protein
MFGEPQSMTMGTNIEGGNTNEPPVPVDAMAGVSMFESVVPNVMAAVPVPVFNRATRKARVVVFGTSWRALDAEVVSDNA